MTKVFSYVFIIASVSLASTIFAALDPPEIRCISIDANNNVTLTWSIPTDSSGEFSNYRIFYRENDNDVFAQIQQIVTYNQTSIQIVGPFDGGAFYMVSTSNGGADVSERSKIVRPIVLDLSSEDRDITIEWSPLNLESKDSVYRLNRQIGHGNWNMIAEIEWGTNKYDDEVNRCSGIVKYQVEIKGIGNCVSTSNTDSISIKDEEAPISNNLICASVDTATGFVNIEWERTPSPDGYGYLINYFEDFIHTDTVFGPDSLTYTYSEKGIDALVQSETLSVAPFDSCLDSINTLWYNQAADSLRFATLFIDTFEYDRCLGKVSIRWNMPTDENPVGVRTISEFRVYRKTGKTPIILLSTVDTEDSIFLDSGLIKGERYTYMVAAYDDNLNKEALSNVFKFRVKPPKRPEILYVRSIRNNHENGLNEIDILTDTTSEAIRYGIYRSLNFNGTYQFVADSKEVSEHQFSIVDPSGEATQSDFYYMVQAFDICDDSMAISAPAKSMYINGYRNEQEYVNDLYWSEYFGFENAESLVEQYHLIRQTNGSILDTIYSSKSNLRALDTIFEIPNINGEVCYYVDAIEPGVNVLGVRSTSRSNLHCESFAPKVFVPNAFSPDNDGINDTWIPNVNFIEVEGYKLSIFDRAGKLVHTTTDPTEGWNGSNQPIAAYAYFLQMQNSRGESVNYSGSVFLIR